MPDNHGASSHASPFQVTDNILPPSMSSQEIFQLHVDFFDTYLKGEDKGVNAWPNVRYYNFSEEQYLTSDSWPLAGVANQRYYFQADNKLDINVPQEVDAADDYSVNFSTSTGKNRWLTQLGDDITGLHDRGSEDANMLTYTSEPLAADLQITGTPVVSVELLSSHSDGLLLAYLEVVDEDGQSRYVTEGGLRLIHRKVGTDPNFNTVAPYHSFAAVDRMAMPIGQIETVAFQMLPTSVLVKQSQRIRIAIAGADEGTFDRIPDNGTPLWTVHRNTANASYVELPVVN